MRTAKIKVQSERELQNAVCKYLKLRYPKVKFRTDRDGQFASRKTLADKAAQSGVKGFPDMIIREKRKGFMALVLELKKEDVTVFKKDGTLRDDQHLREQKEWLDWFEELGCKATFSCGWDETKLLIDSYLA